VEALARRTGPDSDRLELHLMAGAATAALQAAIEVWTADHGRRDLTRLVEEALDHLANGFVQHAKPIAT
jgi:hypothetical protein